MSNRICVSGGFDPLHEGHLAMFREAADHGELVVILNSDAWLKRKKGFVFLNWEHRAAIISDLRYVAEVAPVDDDDDSVCEALARLKPRYFANGGDRKLTNTPEVELCSKLGIDMLWNIGGGKVNSSSEIATHAWVQRPWGRYICLDENEGYKVKKLMIAPGEAISLQYHQHRREMWYVASGEANVQLDGQLFKVCQGDAPVTVEPGVRHKIVNPGHKTLVIIEVQSGAYLAEDDIFRIA